MGLKSVTQAGQPQDAQHTLVTYGLLLFAAVSWGGSFVAARMVLNARPGLISLSPTMLATVRFLIATLFFLPVLGRQHTRAERLKLSDIPVFLVLGQLSISVYFWLQYTGVRLTSASVASIVVVGGIPLATMLVSAVTLREPLGLKKAAAIAAGAAGVYLVATQNELAVAVESGFLLGTLCLLGNALCFAIYSSLVRSIRARYSPLTITAGMTVAGTVGLVLVSALTEDWRVLRAVAPSQWAAIGYLAIVCSVMAYLAYNHALSRVEASRAAVWIYLEPVVAIVLGILLLGEVLSFRTVAGTVIILLSLYFSHKS